MIKIYVCITGDLFHHGHIAFLKTAREYGNYLIVGVCSDEDAEIYKRRPIMSFYERVEVIECCNLVDEVVYKAPPETTADFINQHQIDIVVATKAYSKETLSLYYSDPQKLGILRLVDYKKGISTTNIIERCANIFNSSKGSLKQL